MAVIQELWTPEIALKRFQGSEFIKQSKDLSYAISGAGAGIVHLPQAGVNPEVNMNPNGSFNAAVQSELTDLTFPVVQYYTTPTVITNFQEKQTSAGFRTTIIDQHTGVLNQSCGSHALHKWAPVTLTANNSVDSGTSKIGLTHFNKAKTLLDKMMVPNDGKRFALVPADLEAVLFEIPEYISAYNMGTTILGEGKLIKFMGFNLISRNTSVSYSAAGALKPIGHAGKVTTPAVDDKQAIVCWHSDFVVRAVNPAKVYGHYRFPQLRR